ncbi:MAG: hypothetical protein EGQ74_14925 [Bacteroides nordii]|nr:hypothetical protein [Bacteroides nordii]
MCMSCSSTCACRTALDVHVKQYCPPGKGTFLSEKDKVQYRGRITILLRGTSDIKKIRPIIFTT